MLESFSPLLHFNDEFLDGLNPSTDEDEVDDWLKPLSFDQVFEHDLQSNFLNFNDIDIKQEEEKEKYHHTPIFHEDRVILNSYSHPQSLYENEFVDLYLPRSSEQQLPTTTTTTTTFRLIQQPKMEPTEMPTTVFVNGNELQFHPIITTSNNHSHGKTIGHTYTSNCSERSLETLVLPFVNWSLPLPLSPSATTSSPLTSMPMQSSIPIVPARVLKGKKFKRGGRVTARG